MTQVLTRPFTPTYTTPITAVFGMGAAARLRAADWAWVGWQGDAAVAWATAVSLPGLDGVVELTGAVASAHRRQGVATAVLQAIIPQLRQAGVRQLSVAIRDQTSAAAHFLPGRGFTLEHVEWEMALYDWPRLPSAPAATAALVHLPRDRAMDTFIALYDRSFGPTAWYQPFSCAEVAATLAHGRDLCFWQPDAQPIGFAWVRTEESGIARIEPIGIVPEQQGQGHGRHLLTAVLHRLAQQEYEEVRMGVWRRNETAVALYKQLGFQQVDTLLYLARNIDSA